MAPDRARLGGRRRERRASREGGRGARRDRGRHLGRPDRRRRARARRAGRLDRRRSHHTRLLKDALALAAQVRAGDVSPRELVDAAIARAEAANPELNFLVTESFEQARAATPENGPFAGVPMLVKDLTETAGIRTTFSSRAFADYVPTNDAAVVRRLKQAGFAVIGKSNTPEFGITAVTES